MARRPDYQRGGVTLYCGDCLDILPTLEPGSVDCVLTDPPYGLDYRGESWDSHIPDWFGVARPLSNVLALVTAPTTQWDYPRPDWIACWYRPASSSRTSQGGFNHWSPILVYGEHKLPVDVCNLHAIANAYPKGFGHPSPKPERLFEWLIRCLSPESGLILDPFIGSGTTAVAAIRTGRRCIGIEKESRYFDIAVKRIEAEFASTALLDAVAPRETQAELELVK